MSEIPNFTTKGLDTVAFDRLPNVMKFRESLDNETDRGCAIAAVSYIDHELAEAIKARLIDSEETLRTVFQGQGGLSAFSARIDVGYLLGLYGENGRRELHSLRKVRNEFAHSPLSLSFKEQSISDRCKALKYSQHEYKREPRVHFCSSATCILALLYISISQSKKPNKPLDWIPSESEKAEARAKGAII